jgi:hypothetical protein
MNASQHARNTCCPLSTSWPAILEEFDLASGLDQPEGSGKPREARSDDGYTGRSQEPTMTRSFSDRESDVRPRSGKSGSRSIFSRMRS